MAVEIRIPRLGWSMDEGTFAGWLKQPGDAVRPNEPLFTLEGEKATQEIESIGEGLLHLAPDSPRPGQVVLVGRLRATLRQINPMIHEEARATIRQFRIVP